MTNSLLSKEQQTLLANFGSAMEKIGNLIQDSNDLLKRVTEMTETAQSILDTMDAREERIRNEAKEEISFLKTKANEEITKQKKRVKALENKIAYEKRTTKEDFEV